jgi:hypothetical protein
MKYLIIALTLTSFSAFSQQYSSQTVCHAETPCLDYYGNIIGRAQCNTYGSSYISNGASTRNSCNWFVQPYVGVKCSGYVQVQNQYGQYVWSWQNAQAVCPRN